MAKKDVTPLAVGPARQRLECYYSQPELWDAKHFDERPEQRLRARVIAAMLDEEVENVLDVGCGNGFVTRHLHARNHVVGLDPSETALAGFGGACVVGRGDALPYADRAFEAGVCTEVLEHLSSDDLAKVVSELSRVVRTYLVIGVPYREDLRSRLARCARCGRRYHVDLHRRSFRRSEDVACWFPCFSKVACVFVHEREEIRSRLFRLLMHWFLGPDEKSAFARCPDCGSGDTVSAVKPAYRRVRRWFFAGLGWRMPKRKVPRWMILLLRRNTGSESFP